MKRLLSMIEERGWKGRMVPVDRIADIKDSILRRYNSGLIDEELYRDQLDFFSYSLPRDLPNSRSIIIVATPTPPMRITFHWHGEPVPVVVPPTYVSYTSRTHITQALLAEWLENEGYHLAEALLPLKTLAVQSGLASYGRNNICYVDGMGSFLQLVGAFSDIPCDEDSWREPAALNRCEACTACIHKCPTGAITRDRFLLFAERCLTYHNEAVNDFPAWIDPSWHHCLIGCMRCQNVCPENKGLLGWFEDREEFSEHETALLINHVPFDQLPEDTVVKIRRLEINEDYRFLCRNLAMILRQIR